VSFGKWERRLLFDQFSIGGKDSVLAIALVTTGSLATVLVVLVNGSNPSCLTQTFELQQMQQELKTTYYLNSLLTLGV
jgi:diphthamide synthase (EF-2-diphthine--ammonia ligase)